ncbi:golgin subfamily A member 1 isoform X1 [Athalia rosae]|uniref:golgin subfamily A member 1 isoform X1 n=1 Tax=Athalia rosae TaxID=37344 RepID=UPI002034413A|nr:golgin subfamily A member 1 isoform X1 [Athalia rosae]XP_048508172.1 golgin subfamily A member 1 isoform X1 [Athalia rosae]
MFVGLKNKIREETGSDVSTVVRKAGNVRNVGTRHASQTGSTSSISGSMISLDGFREDNTVSPTPSIQLKRENSFEYKLSDGMQLSSKDIKKFECREEEWKKRLLRRESELLKKIEKKDEEWKVRMQEREKDWKKVVDKHEKEKLKLEGERKKAEDAVHAMELALRNAEEYKKKLYSFQEDAEQLEGFQTQEMAKIKHLLLAKEQEVEEKIHHLKNVTAEVENLKTEVSRLRRYEDELNTVQDEMETLRHSTQRERAQLSSQLAQTEEEVRHLKDKVFVLEQRVSLESNAQTIDERVADLMRERTLLERKLEEAHLHLSDIKTSWSGKISSLETQVGRLSRQAGEEGLERRRVEKEKEELQQKVKQLEAEVEVNNVVMQTKDAKLLRMAEDIDEMATELKELRASVDDEVEEFKREIESSSREIVQLKKDLQDVTEKLSHSTTELAQQRLALDGEKASNASLHLEVARLRESLEIERTTMAKLQISLEKERGEKDSALLRNAQVSQDVEMARQECRQQESENYELHCRVENLEATIKNANSELEQYQSQLAESRQRINELEKIEHSKDEAAGTEKLLKTTISDMEDQLNEKSKTIKVLQQRLSDMKKTLQRELRIPSTSLDSDVEPATAAVINPSSTKTVNPHQNNPREEDVNFKYLKHVLIKFLTSREYEALHLTRAVATLLHFSPEEEKLLQETLEWKMSWFGNRPNLGIGQTAKAIPPS